MNHATNTQLTNTQLTNFQKVQLFFNNRYTNLTKDVFEWLPHSLTAGTVATVVSTIWNLYPIITTWPFNPAGFIAGSAFLTGGLSFVAFEIGLRMGDNYADGILYGLATTVAFSYIASVPLITVLTLTVLGELGKIIIEEYVL